MFTMENCFYLLISQAVRYLRDPGVHPRDKQRMKQELSSELVWMSGWPAGKAAWVLPIVVWVRTSGPGPHSSSAFLAEHAAFQPLKIFQKGSPQLPCCWSLALTTGEGHLSLQSQPRVSGASDPTCASLCPARAEIGRWSAIYVLLPTNLHCSLAEGTATTGRPLGEQLPLSSCPHADIIFI